MKLLTIGVSIFAASAIPVIMAFYGLPVSFEAGGKIAIIGAGFASIVCAVYSMIELVKVAKILKGM